MVPSPHSTIPDNFIRIYSRSFRVVRGQSYGFFSLLVFYRGFEWFRFNRMLRNYSVNWKRKVNVVSISARQAPGRVDT